MPKIAVPLSVKAVNSLKTEGWHAVGGTPGLLLQIRKTTTSEQPLSRSWILRIRINGKREIFGLGTYPQTSLSLARDTAQKILLEIKQGDNPKIRRKKELADIIAKTARMKTFKECATSYIEAHSSDYKNDKHRKQWESTLEAYAYPLIGNMLVSEINMRDILDVLKQKVNSKGAKESDGTLWDIRTVTASRLLGRVKSVFDFAIVNEYRSGTNPAQWSGYLDTQLPSPKKKGIKHHDAIPYQSIGEFMLHLRKNQSISAKALDFLILTGVRSGAVRNAEWRQIDWDNKIWVIPKENTKTNRYEHRVPLSKQAINLLKSMPRLSDSQKIFPNREGGSLSDMAISEIMRGMRERGEINQPGVPHGFRSTFRDWAAEQTEYPDEIRKAASGHLIGDSVQQAYQRTDLLDKRRKLMADWANFLDIPKTSNKPTVKK
jgi:integrase